MSTEKKRWIPNLGIKDKIELAASSIKEKGLKAVKYIKNPYDIDRFYLNNEYYIEYIDKTKVKELLDNNYYFLAQGRSVDVFNNQESSTDDKYSFVMKKTRNSIKKYKDDLNTKIPFSNFRNDDKIGYNVFSFDKLNNASLVENSSEKENSIKFYNILDPLYHYLHFFRYQLKMLLKGYKEPYFLITDMVNRSLSFLEKNKENKYNYKKFILDHVHDDEIDNKNINDVAEKKDEQIGDIEQIGDKPLDIIDELHKQIEKYNIDIKKNINIQKYYPILETTTLHDTDGIVDKLQKYYDIESTIDELDNNDPKSVFSNLSAKYTLQIAVLYIEKNKNKNKNNYILKSNINNNILGYFFEKTVMTYDSYEIKIDSERIADNNVSYESLITKLKELLTPGKKGGLKNKTIKNEKQYNGGFPDLGIKKAAETTVRKTVKGIKKTVRNLYGETPLYKLLNQIFFKTACYINQKIINDMKQLLKNPETEAEEQAKKIALKNAGYDNMQPYIYLFILKTIRKSLSLGKKFDKLSELTKSIVNGEKKYVNNNSINEDKITEFLQ